MERADASRQRRPQHGLPHNELYRGNLVWERQIWSKSRETGTRRSRLAPVSERVTTCVPQLRIVSDDLWDAVRRRYEAVVLGPQTSRPEAARRRVRLLSGLVRCGVCDGPMVIGGAEGRLTCSVRRERGPTACSNGRGVRSDEIKSRVTTALRQVLLEPAVVEEALREHQALAGQRRKEDRTDRAKQEPELAEVKRRAARLVDQVADGILSGAAVKDKLDALEARRTDLEASLSAAPSDAGLVLHPATPERFRRMVERLNEILVQADTVERQAAREAFRALIRKVVVTPLPEPGRSAVTVVTEWPPSFPRAALIV